MTPIFQQRFHTGSFAFGRITWKGALSRALILAWLLGIAPALVAEPPQKPLVLPDCDIYLIDRVELAAVDAGALAQMLVQPGDLVKANQVLAALDDQQAVLTAKAARRQLEMAVAQQRSNVDIEFAEKSERIAHTEWERIQSIENVVTPAERASVRFEWEKAKLQIAKAKLDAQTAKLTADIRQAELEQAEHAVARRKVLCPFDGAVLETKSQVGEWVALGQTVVVVARLDRLRLKAYAPAASVDRRSLVKAPCVVEAATSAERMERFPGQISFVSPVVDSDGRFEIWCDITNLQENGDWLLTPGLRGSLTVPPRKPDARGPE